MIKSLTAALLTVAFIATPNVMASQQDDNKQAQSQQQGKPADYIKIVGVSEHNNKR